MAPSTTRDLSIDSYCGPSIGADVVDVKIVKGNVLNCWENCIISTAKDDELVLEESGRVLGPGNRTTALWVKTLNIKLYFRCRCSLVLSSLIRDDFVVLLEVRLNPKEVISLVSCLIDSSK